MATTITAGQPNIVIATEAGIELTVLPDRDYTLSHLGDTGLGVATAVNVFVGIDAAPTATTAAGANKGVVQAGTSKVYGPGVDSIHLKTASGDGNVAIEVIPGPAYMGNY